MAGWIAGGLVGLFFFGLACWRWGYEGGVVDTERRWSDAVGRAEHEIMRRAKPGTYRGSLEDPN